MRTLTGASAVWSLALCAGVYAQSPPTVSEPPVLRIPRVSRPPTTEDFLEGTRREPQGEQRTYFNDVWRSSDGVTWHRIIAAAPWSPRADAHLVAFRDSLWLVGGQPNDGVVWSTRDGVTWVAYRATGLPRRPPQAVLVFNGALWILGHGRWGEATNDVWTSADGAVRHEVRSEAPWVARTDPGFGVAKGRLWVIAGEGRRDVWSSGDGRQWARSNADLPGPPRTADFVASHRDGVWVFGILHRAPQLIARALGGPSHGQEPERAA